jgi:hypothetical protein
MGFLEQQARFPAVRHMRCQEKAKPIFPGAKLFSIGQGLRRAAGYHIVDAHQFGDKTTYGRCGRRERLPFREGAAFIGLEMTEADPSDDPLLLIRNNQRPCRLIGINPLIKHQLLQRRWPEASISTLAMRPSGFKNSSLRISPGGTVRIPFLFILPTGSEFYFDIYCSPHSVLTRLSHLAGQDLVPSDWYGSLFFSAVLRNQPKTFASKLPRLITHGRPTDPPHG